MLQFDLYHFIRHFGKPVLSGQPLLSGQLAHFRGLPLKRGLTVVAILTVNCADLRSVKFTENLSQYELKCYLIAALQFLSFRLERIECPK